MAGVYSRVKIIRNSWKILQKGSWPRIYFERAKGDFAYLCSAIKKYIFGSTPPEYSRMRLHIPLPRGSNEYQGSSLRTPLKYTTQPWKDTMCVCVQHTRILAMIQIFERKGERKRYLEVHHRSCEIKTQRTRIVCFYSNNTKILFVTSQEFWIE
jgi:hypothetical protein